MEELKENSTPFESAVKAGLIIGAINIFITIMLYVINPETMAIWWLNLLIMALNFILVVMFGLQYRRSVGGYLSFGKAYLHGFVTLVVASLAGLIFNILLYTVIDPDLAGVITDASIEQTSEFMQRMGAEEQAIDEAIAGMEEDMVQNFTFMGFLYQFGLGIVVSALIALLTGLIVKKNLPVQEV